MLEAAKMLKKEAVHVEKSKMVNGEKKGTCARPGETCSPSTQISCCRGSTCNIPEPKPGASGTCVSENSEQCKKINEVCCVSCSPSAGLFCCEHLRCKPDHPELVGGYGKCVA